MRFHHDASSRRGAGFSLIETLVVITIIGILAGLTMSAVQRVRMGAAKTTCSNQLRQLSLALHIYANRQGNFPPGTVSDNGREPYPFLSFHARLLPDLEQNARWEQTEAAFRETKNFLDDPPHTNLSTAMPQFGCPLDPRTLTPQLVYGKKPRGLTSYLGVEGTNSAKQDGVLFLDSRVRPTDVTDGLSNTLVIGERPPSPDFLFGWWYAGWGQDKDGELDMLLGTRVRNNASWIPNCSTAPYAFQSGSIKNPCDTLHFWSLHTGGANFAFGDGSVRFLRYEADSILPALATRAGGETVVIE